MAARVQISQCFQSAASHTSNPPCAIPVNKTLGNVFRRHLAGADDGFTGCKRELRVVRDGPFSVLLESDRSGLNFKRPAHRITERASYNATTCAIVQAQYRVIRQWWYAVTGTNSIIATL